MSKRLHPDEQSVHDQHGHDRPAVGLIATEENADQIVGQILRARKQGHEAIVTARSTSCEGLELARTLDDGILLVIPPDSLTESESPKERLRKVARNQGYPGLLYVPDPSQRIDYTASSEELADAEQFAVTAQVEPVVEQEPTTLVGIPAYNEAATIGPVITSAIKHADEVLVVDDGSDDDTANRAETAGATVIQHETNRGYGAALKTLFEQADKSHTDHLVTLDGDGQHDANDVSKIISVQQETDADIVIGSRFGEEADTRMPMYRRFGLAVVNFLTNLSLGVVSAKSRVRDTQSGFRGYNSRAIESLAADDTIGDHMHASIDILYHAYSNNYDIEEVPTTIDYEVDDGSSQHPLQHGIVLVMNIVRTIERERPITLLGIPGVVCTLVGFGFGYWTFSNYVQSGIFPTGIAILSSLIVTVGILTAFSAIILHSLSVHEN